MNNSDFTLAERNHLISLLIDRRREGSYYGPREQYRQRERRLLIKLGWLDESDDSDSENIAP